MDLRIISIGTLAAHPLWGERGQARTGHATTTLIRSGDKAILVDPGLPEAALTARLGERANLKPSDITHVFITSFRPDTRRGLMAFDDATWWVGEAEREAVGGMLATRLKQIAETGDEHDSELIRVLEQDVAILRRCEVAPDKLAEGVDLFPLPGVTPGLCGLIAAHPRHTTVICGDAIPTIEHLEQGKVLPSAVDVQQAQESFREAVEIGDYLVLGRDNFVVNPLRKGM
ncbi:MAG: MBL fold metallo-hydrolase [Phycisphaerales bacterium]|nr:MBL fold metallo-hydrolase [Phycisphaerales bacterium]